MGLTAYIYRNGLENCSNGGLSSKYTRVCVTNISGPDKPREDAPAVELVVRELGRGKYVHAEPVDSSGHCMFGGCLISTSDSRFGDAVAKLAGTPYGFAIKLHDRVE